VAVEVFEGNTADPNTLSAAIEKLRGRFGLQQLVLVGDRGLLSEARISEELRPIKGLGWITALRAPQLKKLVQAGELSLSRLEEQGLLEFSSADLPGERLLACKNPRLAEERARKREELLQASERELDQLVAATRRSKRALRGKAKIALRLGRLLARFKVAKHFCVEIEDRSFSYSRNQAAIQAEAALDGIYVIRTDVAEQGLAAEAAVRSYKALSRVEQAFRSYKMDLKVRPIFHHLPKRVRAHIFLCMLAYFLEWHMRRALAPLLFDEHDPVAARARQGSVVNAAQRSLAAQQKALSKRTEDGLPVHSFQTLLADLATLSKNRVCMGEASFDQLTSPTPLQERVFELLGVSYRG
jgi:transposase